MGRAGAERAAIEGGLTLRQVAEQLSARLGFEVTPQQVHYLAKRKGAVTVGRTAIVVPRTVEVDAIAPGDLDKLEAAARVALRPAQDMP